VGNIRAMLDLSTAHVPGPEPDWGDLKVQVHQYGWIVWAYDPDDSLSPDWMKPIMKLAYQKNCALILFDSDADEWEDTELHKVERFPGLWSDNSIHESGWYDPKEEAMTENDECPVCKCGTLEKNENDLVCRGECGAIFPDVLGRYDPKEEGS